jgi:glycosyltransferase involved in cell wall biosynthesis
VTPRVTIVIPVYNEGESVVPVLERIAESVLLPFETLLVYDTADDTTAPVVGNFGDERFRGLLNTLGPGPARAIRSGFAAAKADVVVVTMADGSDDVALIDSMTRLVERGCVVVAASRYMSGGAQVGGPLVKGALSRTAGLLLYWFARAGTHDATNSFKAYSRPFLEEVGVDSDAGFELGIELVAKARRMRRPVGEVPTIWLDRTVGQSRFRLRAWLPRYMRWFLFAFGRRLPPDRLGPAQPVEAG